MSDHWLALVEDCTDMYKDKCRSDLQETDIQLISNWTSYLHIMMCAEHVIRAVVPWGHMGLDATRRAPGMKLYNPQHGMAFQGSPDSCYQAGLWISLPLATGLPMPFLKESQSW